MYIKKDGTVLWFINSKAQKNFLKLGRDARDLKWTGAYRKGTVPVAKGAVKPAAEQKAKHGQNPAVEHKQAEHKPAEHPAHATHAPEKHVGHDVSKHKENKQ